MMNSYEEAVEYVAKKVMEEWKDKQYNTDDITDVIHAELDYYCSTMYESEATDIIVSYGLTNALREYDSQGFSDCPRSSFQLLYVIMYAEVREQVESEMEEEKEDKALVGESEPGAKISEETAYEYGLEIWLRIGLHRCLPSIKEKIMKSDPKFMEHYAKQEGFESIKDANRFFKHILHLQYLRQQTPNGVRQFLEDFPTNHAELIQTILEDKSFELYHKISEA